MLCIDPIELYGPEPRRRIPHPGLLSTACALVGALGAALLGGSWHGGAIAASPDRPIMEPGMVVPSAAIVRADGSVPRLEFAGMRVRPAMPHAVPVEAPQPAIEAAIASPVADQLVVDQPGVPQQDFAQQAIAQQITEPQPVPASSAAPARSAQAAGPAGRFVVQAGAFSREANARRLREQLQRRGVAGEIVVQNSARGTAYHLVLGRFATWDEAQAARRELATELRMELIAKALPSHRGPGELASI